MQGNRDGLDVYDPTTGVIRNSTTDDIACWFIDTDYDGENFVVRHAYFTGADEPYDRLKPPSAPTSTETRLGDSLHHQEPPFRPAHEWEDRGQGHQPLRRRGLEGLRAVACFLARSQS